MSIKPSAAGEIRGLIDSLTSSDDTRREGAIARLAVIGGRAFDRLSKAFAAPGTSRELRIGVLRVLERTADARTLPLARQALEDGGDVAIAGAAALRPLLNAEQADTAATALDALIMIALDRHAERRVRSAAVEALHEVPGNVRARVAAALAKDEPGPAPAIRQATWQDAVDGHLPDDPAALREAIQSQPPSVPLSDLLKLIDATRQREAEVGAKDRAYGWRVVRGALHQALGLRNSTGALYDLRETFSQTREELPAMYIAALHAVGDESCLEPIAAALSRAGISERWQHELARAFHTIVAREKVGARSALRKRIDKRWPEAIRALSTTSRTTPRRKTPGRT